MYESLMRDLNRAVDKCDSNTRSVSKVDMSVDSFHRSTSLNQPTVQLSSAADRFLLQKPMCNRFDCESVDIKQLAEIEQEVATLSAAQDMTEIEHLQLIQKQIQKLQEIRLKVDPVPVNLGAIYEGSLKLNELATESFRSLKEKCTLTSSLSEPMAKEILLYLQVLKLNFNK